MRQGIAPILVGAISPFPLASFVLIFNFIKIKISVPFFIRLRSFV
jgi:hypothetical protein